MLTVVRYTIYVRVNERKNVMPNKRSEKRKSTSVTLDKKLLEKLKQIAAETNTNVSNLLEEIAREKYGIKENEQQKK